MIRALQMKTLLLCSLLLLAALSQAQGWMKKYSPDVMMATTSVYNTTDGNYLTTGWNLNNGPQRLMKIKPDGSVLWAKEIDSIQSVSFSNITQDEGLAIIYYDSSQNRRMLRTDANGQVLWRKLLHPKVQYNNLGNADIDTTDNGGFICSFTAYDTSTEIYRLYVCRLDAGGDTLWKRSYYDTDSSKYVLALRNSKDGGFLVTIGNNSTIPASYRLFKLDGNGDILWENPTQNKYLVPSVASDGNIWLCGSNAATGENTLQKLDQYGNEVWSKTYPMLPDSSVWYTRVIERADGKLALSGSRYINSVDRFSFCVVDTTGTIHLFRKIAVANLGYNLRLLQSGYKNFTPTAEGGYLLGGWIQNEPSNYSAFLIKMDSAGNIYPAIVAVNTFYDDNQNCTRDGNEPLINPVTVTFTSVADTFTVLTRDSGYFALGIDTVNYSLHVTPPSPYWVPSACNISNIQLPAGTTDSTIQLGLKPVVYSPYITINGNLNRQRACTPATYTAQYCNTGTAPFTGILIIEVDTLLHVDSTSVPIVTSIGNKYYFVVPQLDAMQCATLKIYCTVSCNPAYMGRVVCVDAHAEQDTVINVSPLWDRSNLQLAVVHNPQTDTITFTLKNIGNGNMSNPKSLLVIEDNVILMQVPVQLATGAELIQQVPANGATWRGTIEQTAFNPYSKFATAAIEAAGTNQQGGVSLGYFMDYPINGYYGYHYTACGEIRNSYDPNEKTVMPEGAGTDKLIDSTTELEYTLYFQNTGNDTAYVIRITDTLADFVDPATIIPGAASHKYTVEFIDKNVLEFTFANINLPDSGTNQLGSNGFVKFRIKQRPGNTSGTVINNKVDIYFDFNPPITTNTATVRIGKVLVTGIERVYANKAVTINAYPNPFTSSTTISLAGETFDKLQLRIYDLSGRMIKQQYSSGNNFTITNDNLQAGTYVFEITDNNQPVGRGKLLVQ